MGKKKIYSRIKNKIGRQFRQLCYSYIPYYSSYVNIITNIQSKGLLNDSVILRRVLRAAGIKVRILDFESKPSILKSRINIFLEKIPKKFLQISKYNLFIPNPEWAWEGDDDEFIRNNIDCVIAKTKDCEAVFSTIAEKVYYTSFTSNDKYIDNIPKREYGHFAGKSNYKGTKILIDLWNKEKKLPKLHLYSYSSTYDKDIRSGNITYRCDMLTDDEITRLQNHHMFHLCPSEYEGFGHQINEAKSAKSIVFTTDAPPMNELVKYDFGILVESKFKERVNRAKLYSVCEEALCEKVIESMHLSENDITEMSNKSRLSYLENDSYFRERILILVSEYL